MKKREVVPSTDLTPRLRSKVSGKGLHEKRGNRRKGRRRSVIGKGKA